MPDPGRGWHRGRRPPWWPEGEAWPPDGWGPAASWRPMRRRFLARVALFVSLLVLVAVGGATLLFLAAANALGGAVGTPHGVFVIMGVVILVALVAGGARRAAMPIGDLIEAAGRVEAGDYAARVPERGAREIRGLARAFNTMASRLDADERRRRALLADVSHELRTPLSVMQGTLEALLDGVYPADREHLASLVEETRTLSRLVDDLRTLSLAEAGQLRLHREPTDLAALVRDILVATRGEADRQGVILESDVAANLPELEIDPARTREVLGNLLANALRHTPAGGRVAIRVTSGGANVSVEVTDTGSGMPPDVLARIFDRFYRGPGSQGSGLGLPIARELVAAQGGEIEARSVEGQGTTIRITLPARAPG